MQLLITKELVVLYARQLYIQIVQYPVVMSQNEVISQPKGNTSESKTFKPSHQNQKNRLKDAYQHNTNTKTSNQKEAPESNKQVQIQQTEKQSKQDLQVLYETFYFK